MSDAPDLAPPAGAKLWVAFVIYQVALHLVLPLLIGMALLRSRREPLYRRHMAQRFGFGPVAPRGAVWIYAASLGETRAASPLIRQLLDRGHRICLTHASPAGLSDGHRLFDDPRITHRYVPLDLFWAVGLFLWRQRPSVGIVIEHEIWPAQLMMGRLSGLAMVQSNGNLTEGTVTRDAGALRRIRLEYLRLYAAILTKTPVYRDRYLRVGVAPDRIALVGDLKFDQWIDPAHLAAATRLRAGWAGQRPVLTIASSVEGEEPALLECVVRLLAMPAPPRIVWVPRSPQRFDAVAHLLRDRGLNVARRADILRDDLTGPPPEADILLGDSLGEMNFYCALADLVFVGASLVPHGGHNIIEPLALGRPVVMGPSIYGITFPAEEARAVGALTLCADADALGDMLLATLAEPAALAQLGDKAQGFAARFTGAADRSADLIEALLPHRKEFP